MRFGGFFLSFVNNRSEGFLSFFFLNPKQEKLLLCHSGCLPPSVIFKENEMLTWRKLYLFPGLLTQAACIFCAVGGRCLDLSGGGSQVTLPGPGAQRPQRQGAALAVAGRSSVLPYVKQSHLLK